MVGPAPATAAGTSTLHRNCPVAASIATRLLVAVARVESGFSPRTSNGKLSATAKTTPSLNARGDSTPP
jgi:hypothetical protein